MTRIVLDKELQTLEEQIIQLGALVENALNQSLEAFQEGNQDESETVIVSDTIIDGLHRAIEEHVFRVLLMQQPLAGRDLRYITSLLPITLDLERMGDDAEAIAQFVLRLLPLRRTAPPSAPEERHPAYTTDKADQVTEEEVMQTILTFGHEVRQMLHETMQAFVRGDAEAARTIWMQDVSMDRQASRITRTVMAMLEGHQAIAALASDPHIVQRLTYLLWTSYRLERIADHCTNICERIAFIVEAETDIRPVPLD